MNEPEFALLLTWTCYGNWLPGDGRGYVGNTRSKRGGFQPKHNVPQTRFDADDQESRDLAKGLQRYDSARLTLDDAKRAAHSFVAAAVARSWIILRGAVMANHVHLVVRNCPDDGPDVRRVFKGVGQARLNEEAGVKRRWWTQRGGNRYLHGNDSILAAMRYVEEQEFCLVRIEETRVVE